MELINNNTSYTNKDFNAIYSELLDVIPALTAKWNPTNEADPNVVLVKLMAVLGDKLNYNQDKQILELLPASTTQRSNARAVFGVVGYTMKWYQSAAVKVQFKINEALSNSDGSAARITIPRFTQLTDINKTVSYVTLAPVTLYGDDLSRQVEVTCLQGTLYNYANTDVKLSNLDENYRLYLPNTNIAENGIFVSDGGTDVYDWEQVANVASYPLGNKVFEFGVSDDETTCYLQFPKDVNDVTVSQSISVKYVSSSGKDGNILGNTLCNFTSDITAEGDEGLIATSNISVLQPFSTANGANPETIDEAFKNYKSVVGTFDVAITKEDFKNYINSLYNEKIKVVSNVAVADRTNDPNTVADAYVASGLAEVHKKVVKYDESGTTPLVTPYTLILYMLRASSDYNTAFKLETDASTLLEVESLISDNARAINVEFTVPSATEGIYVGKYALSGQIVTAEKVSAAEAAEIESIVRTGLIQKYSAYNVEFGQQLDYSEIIDTILSLDARIKTVALNDVTYDIVKLSASNQEEALTPADLVDIQAKTVIAGKASLFNIADGMDIKYGHSYVCSTNYAGLLTKFTPTLSNASGLARTLHKGEVITLITPRVRLSKQYSVGCRISWTIKPGVTAVNLPDGVTLSPSLATTFNLAANKKVRPSDVGTFVVSYTNSNGVRQEDTYSGNEIIECSKSLNTSTNQVYLGSSDVFNVYTKSEEVLPTNTTYCLILGSADVLADSTSANKSVEIIKNADSDRITGLKLIRNKSFVLGPLDTLYYTQAGSTGLVKVGSGFTIKNTSTTTDVILSVSSSDVGDLDSLNLALLPGDILLEDNEIVTVSEGAQIRIDGIANPAVTKTVAVTAIPTPLTDASIYVCEADGTEHTYSTATAAYGYSIFSRLDIVLTSDESLVLQSDDYVGIYNIHPLSSGAAPSYHQPDNTTGYQVSFESPVAIVGGKHVITGSELGAIKFDNPSAYTSTGSITENGDKVTLGKTHTVTFTASWPASEVASTTKFIVVPVYTAASTRKLSSAASFLDKTTLSGNTYAITSSVDVTPGTHYIYIPVSTAVVSGRATTTVTFTNNSASAGDIVFGKPVVVNKMNNDDLAIDASITHNDSLKLIHAINGYFVSASPYVELRNSTFNFLHQVALADRCSNPQLAASFFEPIHIYNKFVIPKLDIVAGYKINVNKYSIK